MLRRPAAAVALAVLLALGGLMIPADRARAQVGGSPAGPAGADGSERGAIPGWDGHPGPPGGRVYLTAPEALKEIFGDAASVAADRWRLTREQVRRIRERAAIDDLPDGPVHVYRVLGAADGLRGYAMMISERGKYRPITFMVGVTPDFTVKSVEILVYREDRGQEVRYDRFLRQYRGKSGEDAVRTHRDIRNITGATISVHSVNAGVRRVLATVELLYGGDGTPVSAEVERSVARRTLADTR